MAQVHPDLRHLLPVLKSRYEREIKLGLRPDIPFEEWFDSLEPEKK